MSADEVRTAFGRAFAHRRLAINGYEVIAILIRLSQGVIGLDPYENRRKVCYWKAKDDDTEVWFEVEQSSIDALHRMGLIQRILQTKAAPTLGSEFYTLTPKGETFLNHIPEGYRHAEPRIGQALDDQEFWTVIVKATPNEPSAIYPFIAAKQPDVQTVLFQYDASLVEGSKPLVSGPHSLRWIPPSAFVLEEQPPVGWRIIRSWFDTVMNPVLENLKLQETLLQARNWTWRVPPGHLESIRPVTDSPWQVNSDNLEQILNFYPKLEELIRYHNQQRSELEEACSALHQKLCTVRGLKEAYEEARADDSPQPDGNPMNTVFRRSDERSDEYLDILAQYVVNTADELPGYNMFRAVWNKYRSEFLVSLGDAAVIPKRDSVVVAGERLLKTVNDLIREMKKTRARLSLKFDVPIVSSQGAPDE